MAKFNEQYKQKPDDLQCKFIPVWGDAKDNHLRIGKNILNFIAFVRQ
jgi:hypothetical protein